MPRQSPLRLIKRWKRYEDRAKWSDVPAATRGIYVLYKKGPRQCNGKERYDVVYIGVAGIAVSGRGSARARLKSHNQKPDDEWTHFSLFEVHDNVTREEIREIEILLLGIFRPDPRIELMQPNKGSKKLFQLRNARLWKETKATEGGGK